MDKVAEVFDKMSEVWVTVKEQIRAAVKAIIRLFKNAQRFIIKVQSFSPTAKESRAAQIWLKTKNRRIKAKQWRVLYAYWQRNLSEEDYYGTALRDL